MVRCPRPISTRSPRRNESSTTIASTILQTSTAIATQISTLSPHLLPLNNDVNGDGSVATLDLGLATASKGRALNPSLLGTLSAAVTTTAMIAGLPGSSLMATPAGGFNLVAAIMNAEEDGNTSDTINVPTGDYPVPDLVIESLNSSVPHKTLTIIGQGTSPGQTVADGGGATRVFEITSSVTVIFKDMAIEHGRATDGGRLGGTAALGGGVLIDGGQVTMSNVSVANNSAVAPMAPRARLRPPWGRRAATVATGPMPPVAASTCLPAR